MQLVANGLNGRGRLAPQQRGGAWRPCPALLDPDAADNDLHLAQQVLTRLEIAPPP
jgi:hypothetical protein